MKYNLLLVSLISLFVVLLSTTISLVHAENPINLQVEFNVSFESQNVMKPSGWELDNTVDLLSMGVDYWQYAPQIKNFYIQNEITEIEEYEYEFDVTNDQNGRVMAYLVKSKDNSVCMDFEENDAPCYDLYLQADGIIYLNENASYYFGFMLFLDSINNLEGMDTSNVTDMSDMFSGTGGYSENFTLDLNSFDTSNVTNMSSMFATTGHNSTNITLDLGDKFDTSNVTDMSYMFMATGYNSTEFTLDLGDKFDTSNVTNMRKLFNETGYNSTNFTLDVSNFDTSNVTDMSYMFSDTGYNSTKFNTSITIKNPNLTGYTDMFRMAAPKEGAQITVNYTSKTEKLVDKMIVTKSSNSNVVKGNCIDCGEGYIPIGTEISIGEEKFNVISQTDDTITMLAQYNLGTDYKQSTTANLVSFSDAAGWEYKPGPKEIDIEEWSTNPKTYVNAYVEYLKAELGDCSVTGDLITLKELQSLGCTINDDYLYTSGLTCNKLPYKSWLINNQHWWTSSASSVSGSLVWLVGNNGTLSYYDYSSRFGIRPTITISKQTLKNLN